MKKFLEQFEVFKTYLQKRLIHFVDENAKSPDEAMFRKCKLKVANKDITLLKDDLLLLFTCLAPHYQPGFYEKAISQVFQQGGEFPYFGGVKGKNHRGMIPTGETAQFIIAGQDQQKRKEVALLLLGKSVLIQKGIIHLESAPYGEPMLSGRLIMDQEYAELILYNKVSPPMLSSTFPAQQIETPLSWDDLILPKKTWLEIQDIENWLAYNSILVDEWKLNNIKPGYQVLFYGPPGTGKTLTASLLGKHTNRQVYRIDLSAVVSKYIGETEKNLSGLFQKAENKDWILFFDEADSIFGKRTQVQDAHDKYANQEVSYLLQRIESYEGLVILATNYKSNIDQAFTRRFHSMIEFKLPSYNERQLLWKKNLPSELPLKNKVFIDEIAKKYAITGSHIVNIVQYASLKSISLSLNHLPDDIIIEGIEREYLKEGKTTG